MKKDHDCSGDDCLCQHPKLVEILNESKKLNQAITDYLLTLPRVTRRRLQRKYFNGA